MSKRTFRRDTKYGGEPAHHIAQQNLYITCCTLSFGLRVQQGAFNAVSAATHGNVVPQRIATVVERRMVTLGDTQRLLGEMGISQHTSQS
jgi:hypothetical protein